MTGRNSVWQQRELAGWCRARRGTGAVEDRRDLKGVAHDSYDLEPATTARSRALGDVDGKDVGEQPGPTAAQDIVVPDLAGWRRDRMPVLPHEPYVTLPPDWLCEVLSPRTAKLDRADKLPVYARESVRHVWLLDPLQHTLEVLRLHDGRYTLMGVHKDDEIVNAEPFEVFDLQLPILWADVEPAR